MEAIETIASYSVAAAMRLRRAARAAGPALYTERVALPYEAFFSSVPESHLRFFETLERCHRTADAVCVHAGLDSRIRVLEEQTVEACVWGTAGFPQTYDGEDLVVYGHHNNAVLDRHGWPGPCILGRTIGIDTIGHGVLTALRLPDGEVIQSRRHA
jgi:hypothetical protein